MPYQKTKEGRLVNEVTLGDGYPLSNDKQPLKVGGEASIINVSSPTPDNSVDVARSKGLEALQRLSSVNLSQIDVEPADFEKDDDYNFHVRSPRFEVLRCLHFLGWTRGHLTMKWAVFFWILSRLGPRLPRRRSTS